TIVLPPVAVIATPLGSGGAADRWKIPGTAESLSEQDIARGHSPGAAEILGQRIPGANLNDLQGNPFAQDLRYRGFAASPLQGTPQGLAVYQNGVRLNEAFGDTLNWDLVLPTAIRSIELFSNNPIFGLNALGGAVNIEMKDGFSYQGLETTLQGGSFGRIGSSLQYGVASGPWGLYVAGDAIRDGGWRFQSQSEVVRAYADLGYRVPGSEVHLVLSGAADQLGVIGPTPIELTRLDERSIFTWPQTTRNRAGTAALNGKFDVVPTWKLQGNVYVRRFEQTHVDGNAGDFEACSAQSSFGGQLCLQDDTFGTPPGGKTRAFRDQFVILGPNGATVPFLPGTPYGTIDQTRTGATTVGASLQGTNTDRLLGLSNSLTLGASIDHSDISFTSGSTLGFIYPDLFVGTNPAVPGTGIGPIRTLGNLGFAPVDLSAANTYFGLYGTDTVDLSDRLSFSFGGRLNLARVEAQDASGTAPELNGIHDFIRFNPFAGPAFRLTPDVSVYAGYSESNRVPTPLELSCSDRTHPCLLANALVADPPLKQVVSHTYETGLRGEREIAPGMRFDGKIGLYRTDSEDDIIALASAIQGRGFYANVPDTRRQGIDAAARFRSGPWLLYANYAFVDATFRFTELLPSPNNPAADVNGNVLVHPGDRLPLVPRHQFKAGVDYAVTPRWEVSSEIVALSSQFFDGDQSNQNAPLPAYWVANVHTSYQVTEQIQLFADIRNLLNKRYATYGTFFEPSAVANAVPVPFSDPRTITLAQPLSIYAGIRVTW
ncbi:MAG: TonB-dependent receptor, partial [Alphaproteobacteria bacterium]|nr:TonB-dependent receptor [Alphaproteobacteria bacterium]